MTCHEAPRRPEAGATSTIKKRPAKNATSREELPPYYEGTMGNVLVSAAESPSLHTLPRVSNAGPRNGGQPADARGSRVLEWFASWLLFRPFAFRNGQRNYLFCLIAHSHLQHCKNTNVLTRQIRHLKVKVVLSGHLEPRRRQISFFGRRNMYFLAGRPGILGPLDKGTWKEAVGQGFSLVGYTRSKASARHHVTLSTPRR
jgi:hypothetical protein